MTQRKLLLLGASGIAGRAIQPAFENAGWRVKRFQRGTDMTAAAAGCDLIFNAMNPPKYQRWEKYLPLIADQIIDAAQKHHIPVMLPGNLYNFGETPGPWHADTPMAAQTKKGKVRIEFESTLRKAAIKTIILRAGNFIDPAARGATLIEQAVLGGIKRGTYTRMGPADIATPYAYTPDFARAAVRLADRVDHLPDYVDIGFPGTVFSAREHADFIAKTWGRKIRMRAFPWWILRLAAPFWQFAWEVNEMRYLSEMAHEIDATAFHKHLPDFTPTPRAEILAAPVSPFLGDPPFTLAKIPRG